MMSSENSKTDEIRKIILSLLLSRKGLTPLAILDRDYYDMERKRIPWRKFGYNDLAAFLRSMPEHFEVEWHNGCHYVRGIASEKSKHVSSLVARQKSDLKTRNFRSRLYRPVSRYVPHMQRQRIMLPVEQLHLLVQYIRNYPDGVSMQTIMMVLQQQQPQVVLSVHDVRQQLRELSHQLTMDGEMVYPVLPNNVPQEAKKPPMPAPQTRPEYQDYQAGAICVAGDEDWVEEYNSDVYLLAGYESSNHAAQLQMTSERLAANFMQNMSHKQMCEQQNDYDNNRNADDYFTANIKHSNVVLPKDEAPSDRYSDISTLISDRAKSRLEQLIAKHPEGIPCAKLPDMYLSEYKVRLNYTELGFSSVREYVSYLPNIFYMTRVNATDDFVLYSANKKPTIPDQQTGSQTAESVGTRTNFAKRYEEQVRIKCSDEAIPTDVSPSITSKFAPDDVMNHNDRIDFISVTDLQCNEHLEVYIAEVFTPSFFWIHLRESNKPLRLIMDNLQLFYESNSEAYAIPKVALSKGLNCACIFARRWHRAVIKSVKPDFRVTVMFYDYGTLKTYQSEEVYYLHKQFSHLPAQAIPCGLYNVKPCVGDRWKKSVTEQFMDKVSDYLLDATVMSIDPMHNSMMVILTDTSEEEHVNINDWLVNQNLARQGKLVRIRDNFPYSDYVGHDNIAIQSAEEIPDTRNKIGIETRDSETDQSVSRDEEVHSLSNDYPRNREIDVKENVEISLSRQAIVQILRGMNSLETKSSDTKVERNNCTKTEKPRGPKGLLTLLEKLKTLNISSPESNSDLSTHEVNHAFQDNTRQLDSNVKIDVGILDSNKNFKDSLNVCFTVRDSDERNSDGDTDFRFRSMYGGHDTMQPIDWSMIKGARVPSRKVAPTSANNMDILIKERTSDVAKDKVELQDRKKDELLAKSYFLNMTRKEEEYFLADGNINYDVRSVPQTVINTRNRMEMCNDKYMTMAVTKKVLETLRGDVHSRDPPSPEANIAMINNTNFSRDMGDMGDENRKNEKDIGKEVGEARLDQKVESKNSFVDQKLFPNINNSKRKRQETYKDSSDSFELNTSTMLNTRHRKLLEQMKRNTMSDSSCMSGSSSSSSEQIQSSTNHSYTDALVSSDALTSSDEKQPKACEKNTRFDKLCSFLKCAPPGSDYSKPDNDSKTKVSLSDNSFTDSNDVKESKRHVSNCQSSLENGSSVSCRVDDSKQYQLNATATSSLKEKILQHLLKMRNSSSELDSDDLSNQENGRSNKNDESSDKKDDKPIDEDRTCESMNVSDEIVTPPVFDDHDVETDSTWDANEMSFLPFLEHLPKSIRNIEISDIE